MAHQAQVVSSPAFPHRAATASGGAVDQAPGYVFWMFVAFLVLEYARPPMIQKLHLQLVLLLVLPLIWLQGRADRPWSPLLTVQVLFLGICASGIALGANWFAAYMATRKMYGNVAIGIVISWLLSSLVLLRRGIWAWLLVMTYVALWGITHAGRGTGGFLGDENDLALACITAIPFCFFGIERHSGWRRWVSVLLGLIFIAAVIRCSSRGGFVGLAAVAAYCFFASRHKLRNVVILVTAALFFLILAPRAYIEDLKTITDSQDSTTRVRLFLWTAAFNMWKAHPILGVGGGSFYYQAGDYQPTGPNWEDDRRFQARRWAQAAHSLYFETLSEHGLVGIVALVSLIWLHFRTIRRLRRDVRATEGVPPEVRRDAELYGAALGAAMVGYLTSGGLLSVLYYPYAWYFSGMAVALDVAVRRELASLGLSEPDRPLLSAAEG